MDNEAAIRFWNKVDIKGIDECWLWLGGGTRYGAFKVGGKQELAHRISYELSHNDFMTRFEILHKCDNKKCVNPNHLYQGTQLDNMRDRNERNPVPREKFGYDKAKLYSGELWLIRRLKGRFTTRFVAKMFNVNQMTISKIWRADSWLCKEGYYA